MKIIELNTYINTNKKNIQVFLHFLLTWAKSNYVCANLHKYQSRALAHAAGWGTRRPTVRR